jgi:hypothetical protein
MTCVHCVRCRYKGAGLGEMYGQWQIDVSLANSYGQNPRQLPAAGQSGQGAGSNSHTSNLDVFCEAFVLSGRDEYRAHPLT